MQNLQWYSIGALLSGGLLASMLHLNSLLAAATSAINASWIAHGIGALVAWGLFGLVTAKQTASQQKGETQQQSNAQPATSSPPAISYLGGIPGAFTVVLASLTINSGLGLAGTLTLALVGQLGFSMLCEYTGWFNVPVKRYSGRDYIPIAFVMAGSLLLIAARG